MDYNFAKIEKKWQKKWEEKKVFEVKESSKKKYYVLEQFPYPSGSGLHVGHSFVYTVGDIYARFKRMQGYNVLYPMGFDSFGLPAENAAIKAKSHPKKFTEEAIRNFIKQMKLFGYSYDWSRMIETHKPDFYKWDQWIFLKMFEKNLAYRKKSGVNFCKKCNTVLANEQVHNGKCEYHENTNVEIKQLDQWFLKTTNYADEFLDDLNKLEWPQLIKTLQKNWIGKSFGTEILFRINGEKWFVFTTRPDTLMGVTFMVVSAQHSRLNELVIGKQKDKVDKFLKKIKSVSEKDSDKLNKEGVFTGSYAVHPITNEKIPVYVGNFVLAEYGSGIVMAVPAHDQRDFEFAKKYKIEIKEVVSGGDVNKEPYLGQGKLINSGKFNGLNNHEAKEHITIALRDKKLGKKTVNYKLRDWLVSRQRFWGTPIPIIYCGDCGIVPVPEKDLPVKLPDNIKFSSKENPLKNCGAFLNVKCPMCGNKGKRETDTMDTFVNSSWYFLRYCDPKNSKEIFNSKKVDYWMPIDMYIGGKEHATMHNIYFRFYTKFLRDIGLLNFDEPAKRLFNQGFILGSDGNKMSKSKGNVVLLAAAAKKYGVDSTRFFLVSVASLDSDYAWNDKGAESVTKFIKKIMDYFQNVKITKTKDKRIESKLNKTIELVTKDIEHFNYNLAIIKIRQLFSSFENINNKDILENFLKLLSPFCPHITEELWQSLGKKTFLSLEKWPVADVKKINEKFERQEQEVEKLIKDINNILKIIQEDKDSGNLKIKKVFIYVLPNEKEIFNSETDLIKKRTGLDIEVYSVSDKNKYDPGNKSKKVKPGKPGIYLE